MTPIPDRSRGRPDGTPVHPLRTAASVVAVLVSMAIGASVGLASTGSLPDAMQHVAAQVLDHLGIEVPDPS